MLQLFLDSTPSVPLLRKPFLIKPRYEIDIAKRNGNQKHPRPFHFSWAQEKPFRAPKIPRGTKKPIPVALKPISGTKKKIPGHQKHDRNRKTPREQKDQSGKNDPTGRKNTIPGTKNTEPFSGPQKTDLRRGVKCFTALHVISCSRAICMTGLRSGFIATAKRAMPEL